MGSLTKQGWVGMILAASIILSLFGAFRINLGGLLIHPYLILLLPLAIIGNIKLFKLGYSPMIQLLIYGIVFSLAMLIHEFKYSEVFKIFAGIFSFIFFSKAIKNKYDYHYASYILVLLSLILSIKIIILGQSGDVSLLAGVNALQNEGLGNKNAQSLYILPGTFLLFYLLSYAIQRKLNKEVIFLSITIIPILLGIAYSGNRSGYFGVALILLIFLLNFRINFYLVLLIPIVFYLSFVVLENYVGELISHKFSQTTGEHRSDNLRQDLLQQSILIGLENPVLGKGFDGLMSELSNRVQTPYPIPKVDPHNIYGYLLGGGGFIPFLSFLAFMWLVFKKGLKHYRFSPAWRKISGNEFIGLWLCGYIALYMFRGIFTREILYSPTFMAGLGILYGGVKYHLKVISLKLISLHNA